MLLCNKKDFSFGVNMVGFCRDSHIFKDQTHTTAIKSNKTKLKIWAGVNSGPKDLRTN